jgi:formylglycine-generating enzyme required for sulfatase activity
MSAAPPEFVAFFSYSRVDLEFALKLARDLRQKGAVIWMDKLDIRPGERWDSAVELAMERCAGMLVILSPDSVGSTNVMDEVSFALEEQKAVIPVLHRDCKVPFRLRRVHHVDVRTNYDQGLQDLLGVLKASHAPVVGTVGDTVLPPTPAPPLPKSVAKSPAAGETRIHPKDGLTYVWIPPGNFMMGRSPDDPEALDNESPAHLEQVAEGFWLCRTPVTQAAWKKVMGGGNPSHFKGDQLPVENVSWNDAVAYCNAIGGRLPTEKEWEYAPRAGTTGPRYGPIDRIAWYAGNSKKTTHPVGELDANAFGLYDMLGNVWEWTADNYDEKTKVLRGGSWFVDSGFVRASVRLWFGPTFRDFNVGFRCVGELS